MDKFVSEMHRFHSKKQVQSTDGVEKGRLHSKRRKTIAHLQFHFLEIGTLTKDSLRSEYFNCLLARVRASWSSQLVRVNNDHIW